MGEKLTFSAILWKEGKLQIAWCPELDIASQGKKVEEALANLHQNASDPKLNICMYVCIY